MKKINCIIADDEALARDVMKSHASRLDRLTITATCANGLEVYAALKNIKTDLLFLDIQMPQLTGIELLRTIKNLPPVIITTAYREFALEGYELNVIDYLLKPVSFERFLKAIDKYETWIDPGATNKQAAPQENTNKTEAFIYVKSGKKMIKIMLKDILYMEGLKDYIKICTHSIAIITYQTLAYFEEKLPAAQFMRVHRSFIVSLEHIKSYTATELTIGTRAIPIGSTYVKEVSRKLNFFE
jgi:DNA-binding LytR/AlgR family response regulator